MTTCKQRKAPKRLSLEATSRLIDALGGTNAVSRMTDVSTAAVALWRKRGMPKARVAFLREAYKELPVMRLKEVREL